MREQEYDEFAALLADVWGLKNQALTGGQKAMFFRALAAYPINEVRAGLDAHVMHPERGRFLPMPADVIAQIQGIVADDGRPGAEEAWAVCFRATDERATIVWCGEMAEAFGVAAPLLQAGDEVAARMAFKETYSRLLAEARERRAPPKWSATLGDDGDLRDRTLLPHVLAGRIGADMMRRPELASGAASAPALGLDSLLALPVAEGASPAALAEREKARKTLESIKADLLSRKNTPTPAQVAVQIDRERVAMLKAESAGHLRDYIESKNGESS